MTHTHTHTPGPWTKSGCTVYAGKMAISATYCEGNRFLHGVYHHETVPDSMETHGQGWDEAGANARLIASAPDLMASLGAIAKQAEFSALAFPNAPGRGDLQAIAQMARAAIAKATGKAEA